MTRPTWRSALFLAASGLVGLTVLAGCTSRQYGLSAADETARYLQNARGRYVIPGPPSDPWGPYIREASTRFDMPESWIRALMRQESGGNLYRNGRLITSGAGAMGLMQVMPGTYAELRARHRLGPDPFDPHENIMAGVAYMREMYDMYGSPGFLAAYNAGPNRLDDYLANQRGLPDETRHYVASIGPSLRYAEPKVRSPAQQYAMNQLPLYIPPGARFANGTIPTMAFASAAAPVYRPAAAPVAQPVYAAAQPPRALAWAEPPRPVYTPAPAPAPAQQPSVLAWNEPPRPAPAPVAAPPPRQVAVASREDDERDSAPVRRVHTASHSTSGTRVALIMPPTPPMQRGGGGFHLISGAMAAESYIVHHPGKGHAIPASTGHRPHAEPASGTWKLHVTGPVQAAPGHKGKSATTRS